MIGAEVHSIFMDWRQVEHFEIIASIWPFGASQGAVRKLRKHIGVLSWSEKGNFCLFLVLKRGTQLVKNSQKRAYVIYERPLFLLTRYVRIISQYFTNSVDPIDNLVQKQQFLLKFNILGDFEYCIFNLSVPLNSSCLLFSFFSSSRAVT